MRKIKYHGTPIIEYSYDKEIQIRHDQDETSYQIVILNKDKEVESINYLTKENYQQFMKALKADQQNEQLLENQRFKQILEKYDIYPCSRCKEYTRDPNHCDMCEEYSCGCFKITRVKTWNLSGMEMCDKCLPLYCHFCCASKNNGNELCDVCEKRFDNDSKN